MNQVVIFFVPTNATQRDFETALCEHFDSLAASTRTSPTNTDQETAESTEEYPAWTWFLPNPRP